MVGNDRIASVFEWYRPRRFIRFSDESGQRKRAVGGSGLESHGKDDRALSMNDGEEGRKFHSHKSRQDGDDTDQVSTIAGVHKSR